MSKRLSVEDGHADPSSPSGSVLQVNGAGGLHVLPERARVEAVKIIRELEVDVDFLAALECRVEAVDDVSAYVATPEVKSSR